MSTDSANLSPDSSTDLDLMDEAAYLVIYLLALHHHRRDFAYRMDDRGVIPSAELIADGRIAVIGQFPA